MATPTASAALEAILARDLIRPMLEMQRLNVIEAAATLRKLVRERDAELEPALHDDGNLRGPWVPVLRADDGLLLEDPDELEDDQYADVSIRRGSAAPVNGSIPASHFSGDVLYEITDVEPDDVDPSVSVTTRWEQAKAIAGLLNDAYPA